MYKKSFHNFQKKYISENKNSLKMRDLILKEKNINPSESSILDVGCGSGLDLEFFKDIGFNKIAGIDITGSLVDIARENNSSAEIVHGSFQELEWQDNTFDVVWSKYALQVEKDVEKSISEISRVIKSGGYAFIQVTHPFRTLALNKSNNYFSEEKIVYPSQDDSSQDFVEHHIALTTWFKSCIKNDFKIIDFEEILNKSIEKYSGTITPSAVILVLKKI